MSELTYIRVRWLHSLPDEPVELWSELDADRRELRKVEIWADGQIGYASADSESGGTKLGERSVPSLEDIAADAQFRPEVISQLCFEDCWVANVC